MIYTMCDRFVELRMQFEYTSDSFLCARILGYGLTKYVYVE